MLELRRALPADIPAIVALTEAAYRPYTELLGYPPVPVTEDYAPRVAAGEVWLLEVEGELAGLMVVERHPDHWMLFSIAVGPAFQGQGYGIAMLEWLEAQARAQNCGEIRLYTNARMEKNIALYANFGFRETGRRPNPKRPMFTIVDMAKTLD